MAPYWIAAALTALVSVIYAKVFSWSEQLALTWSGEHSSWAFIITPIAIFISMLVAHYFSPEAAGSGIPQLVAAVEVSKHPNTKLRALLSVRMMIAKFFGSCICVAGGGITGREGPMLQIAAGIFNLVQGLWKKLRLPFEPNLQSMILAGGAAGLASAFNTPLGGIVFAIEELAKVHISHIRTYVFHAVVIAGILAQAILGNYLYLGKFDTPSIQGGEIFPLVLATAFTGMMGALFGRATVTVLDFRSRLSIPVRFLQTILLGFAVALITYYYGKYSVGSGRLVIVDILSQKQGGVPAFLPVVRGVGNFLTYAGGVIGGIFAPALSTGAAISGWLSNLNPGFNHQLWALAGMVAFLTGVTRTPFTSLILVFEMTDSHDLIIYLMLAAIIAQGISKFVDPLSFYEQMAFRIVHGHPPEAVHEEKEIG